MVVFPEISPTLMSCLQNTLTIWYVKIVFELSDPGTLHLLMYRINRSLLYNVHIFPICSHKNGQLVGQLRYCPPVRQMFMWRLLALSQLINRTGLSILSITLSSALRKIRGYFRYFYAPSIYDWGAYSFCPVRWFLSDLTCLNVFVNYAMIWQQIKKIPYRLYCKFCPPSVMTWHSIEVYGVRMENAGTEKKMVIKSSHTQWWIYV